MDEENFQPINRGNGVLNDNLATLGSIFLAVNKKVKELDRKIVASNKEIGEVKATIEKIDKKNTPREIKNFWLLVATVILTAIGILIALIK